jgi:hypothetical protein
LTQKCSKLILASPCIIPTQNSGNFNIDHEEKKIFSVICIIIYWSGAVGVATPYGDIFASFIHKTFIGITNKFINSPYSLGQLLAFAFQGHRPTGASGKSKKKLNLT